MERRMASEWISVSERLPQSAGKVLIARRSFDNPDRTEQWEVEMAEWFPKAHGGGESVFWVEDRYGGTDITLTATGLHWMPLPEPPAP
jgi:hypothetical protein